MKLNNKQIGLFLGILVCSIFLFFSYPLVVTKWDRLLLGFGCLFILFVGFNISKILEVEKL